MSSLAVILLCSLLLLSSVASDSEGYPYNEAIGEAIGFEEIKEKILDSLGDTDEAQLIALKMLDASTKIPNGLLAGNVFDLGNFDECYGINYEDIYGKYCLGTLPISSLIKKSYDILKINTTLGKSGFIHPEAALAMVGSGNLHFAVCVPSNWSASDIPGILTYSEDFCYSKATEPELSTGAVVTIVILSIVLIIIVISTVFDLVLYYKEQELPHELLIAFSAWSNGRKIFKSSFNPDQLLCLNGIKAISTMWVIFGHEYTNVTNAPVSNIFDMIEFEREAKHMFVLGATVSVDTFFVVGGLVTVYTFLKSVDQGAKFNVILYYIHRYLRLTPAFAIMSLIYLYLINYFGNGPLWSVVDLTLVKPCEKGWWSSFLYVTNYVQDGNCIPPTWYLSVDMQLFILSPLVLIPLSRWPKPALGLMSVLAVAGCIVPFCVGYEEDLGQIINFNANNDILKYMDDYYMQTHTRFGPYVIGMILGYFLYQIKKSKLNVRLPMPIVFVLWLICLTGLTACLYAGHPLILATEDDKWGNSLFLAFNRQAWSVALCGVIFLCITGYGGPINKFLSLSVFQIITKVSYSMYLIHYAVIVMRYSAMRNTLKFSNFNLMHAFWGDFTFTFVLSILLSLSFESPVIILEKYLFGRGPTEVKPTEKKPEV